MKEKEKPRGSEVEAGVKTEKREMTEIETGTGIGTGGTVRERRILLHSILDSIMKIMKV